MLGLKTEMFQKTSRDIFGCQEKMNSDRTVRVRVFKEDFGPLFLWNECNG
jgi:hypothetical protein